MLVLDRLDLLVPGADADGVDPRSYDERSAMVALQVERLLQEVIAQQQTLPTMTALTALTALSPSDNSDSTTPYSSSSSSIDRIDKDFRAGEVHRQVGGRVFVIATSASGSGQLSDRVRTLLSPEVYQLPTVLPADERVEVLIRSLDRIGCRLEGTTTSTSTAHGNAAAGSISMYELEGGDMSDTNNMSGMNVGDAKDSPKRDLFPSEVGERVGYDSSSISALIGATSLSKLHRLSESSTAKDLTHAARRALVSAAASSGGRSVSNKYLTCSYIDLERALLAVVRVNGPPGSSSETAASSSVVKWEDVGGLKEAKAQILDTFRAPVLYPSLFYNSPVRASRNVLLYGPPGCGKTHLARAVADKCGLHCVTVAGPQLLNKYIGASEKAVRTLFENARASNRPTLLLFDEFESLAPKRGRDRTGVTDRVVNQLLTFLDGAEDTLGGGKGEEGEDGGAGAGGQVFVLCCTSRPDLVDAALLRPGRVDTHIYLGLPSAAEAEDMLLTALQPVRTDAGARAHVASLGPKCVSKTLCAADLKAVASTAFLLSTREKVSAKTNSKARANDKDADVEVDVGVREQSGNKGEIEGEEGEPGVQVVTAAILQEAFDATRPSLAQKDREFFQEVHAKFRKSGKGKTKAKDKDQVGNSWVKGAEERERRGEIKASISNASNSKPSPARSPTFISPDSPEITRRDRDRDIEPWSQVKSGVGSLVDGWESKSRGATPPRSPFETQGGEGEEEGRERGGRRPSSTGSNPNSPSVGRNLFGAYVPYSSLGLGSSPLRQMYQHSTNSENSPDIHRYDSYSQEGAGRGNEDEDEGGEIVGDGERGTESLFSAAGASHASMDDQRQAYM